MTCDLESFPGSESQYLMEKWTEAHIMTCRKYAVNFIVFLFSTIHENVCQEIAENSEPYVIGGVLWQFSIRTEFLVDQI
jgi:hypothetical protein